MAWLDSTPAGIPISKRTNKSLVSKVIVSGTTYKLYQTETVETTVYRGLTPTQANTLAVSTTYNYDNFSYSNWVTGSITHIDVRIDGSKSNAAYSRKWESDGYHVTVTKTTQVSSTT